MALYFLILPKWRNFAKSGHTGSRINVCYRADDNYVQMSMECVGLNLLAE